MFELCDHLIVCHVAQIDSSTHIFIPQNGHLAYVSGLPSVLLRRIDHLIFLLIAFFAALGEEVSGRQTTQYANYTELSQAVHASLQAHERVQQQRQLLHGRSKRAVKRVCYGELGCFEDSGPFAYLEMLPSPPEEINTKFYFYSTRQRSDRPLMELSFLNMTAAFARSKAKRESETSTAGPAAGAGRAATTNAATGDSIVTTEKPPGSGKKTPTPSIDDLEGFDELSVRVIVHGFGSACPHVWIYEMKTALMAVVGWH